MKENCWKFTRSLCPGGFSRSKKWNFVVLKKWSREFPATSVDPVPEDARLDDYCESWQISERNMHLTKNPKLLILMLPNVWIQCFDHVNHIETTKIICWIWKLNLKLLILSYDRIHDYFRIAHLSFFLRRLGGVGRQDSHKNARENRKLIPKNPRYLSTQVRCQKKCTVVGLKSWVTIIYDYLRKNPPCNECVRCRETWLPRLHIFCWNHLTTPR